MPSLKMDLCRLPAPPTPMELGSNGFPPRPASVSLHHGWRLRAAGRNLLGAPWSPLSGSLWTEQPARLPLAPAARPDLGADSEATGPSPAPSYQPNAAQLVNPESIHH